MKHVLNGVAIAAVIAISAPVWAQMPPKPAPAAPPAATAPAAPGPAMQAHHPMHHVYAHRRHWWHRHHAWYWRHHHHWWWYRHGHWSNDFVANTLNKQELARITGGMTYSVTPGAAVPPPPPIGSPLPPSEGPRPSGH